jgi:hypothetical protein
MYSHSPWFTTRRMVLVAAGVAAMSAMVLTVTLLNVARATVAEQPHRVTLLGALAEWKYPGSIMLGGATMSDGGNKVVVDVRCQAILTTTDPAWKVIEFYSEKLSARPRSGGQNAGTDAKAVSTQDDSEGRPVTVRAIVVNKADTTTTLVISRAKSEDLTHIAWTHYRWFDGQS